MGIVGSYLANRNSDIDIIAVVRNELPPTLFHLPEKISVLAFDVSWLNYETHEARPMGLVPSILFKTLQLSKPLLGDKSYIAIPKIEVCRADWINVRVKKNRFNGRDRKNYLVALIFEKLLETSPDLSMYEFDNVAMAKKLGLIDISEELIDIYNTGVIKH